MPSKTCFYKDCKANNENHPERRFLPFVKNTDIKRCKHWIELCGRHVPVEKIGKNTYICNAHFRTNEDLDWKSNVSREPIPFCRLKVVDKDAGFVTTLQI